MSVADIALIGVPAVVGLGLAALAFFFESFAEWLFRYQLMSEFCRRAGEAELLSVPRSSNVARVEGVVCRMESSEPHQMQELCGELIVLRDYQMRQFFHLQQFPRMAIWFAAAQCLSLSVIGMFSVAADVDPQLLATRALVMGLGVAFVGFAILREKQHANERFRRHLHVEKERRGAEQGTADGRAQLS